MALIRWEPVGERQPTQQDWNRLFGAFFYPQAAAGPNGARRRWTPAMDLVEEDDHFVLRADLPGVGEDDVKVELEDNVLTVSGARHTQHEDRKDGYYRVERASGRFSRSLTLPEGVDAAAIQARLEHGVLEVRVPKPEERKPHRIAIEVGANGKAPVIEGAETASGPENASS